MIPPGYRIRPALPADIPSLAGVERAADERFVALAGQLGLPGAALAQVTERAVLERALDEGRLWVASSGGGTVVGFALAIEVAGFVHLEQLAVVPDEGGAGLGSALLEAVVERAAAAGRQGVTLCTFRDVAWNAPFYSRRGFTAVAPEDLSPGHAAIARAEAERGLAADTRVTLVRRLPATRG
jgi:GNAT superfamily N-acetyltransferase